MMHRHVNYVYLQCVMHLKNKIHIHILMFRRNKLITRIFTLASVLALKDVLDLLVKAKNSLKLEKINTYFSSLYQRILVSIFFFTFYLFHKS